MKIAFIGEAISGFGGMETVIRNIIHTLQNQESSDICKLFFFCRNDKMDKKWLEGLQVSYHHSKQKISWLRRHNYINALSHWLTEHKPNIVICFDTLSCFFARKARDKIKREFTIFSWTHFSLDHKKKSEYIRYADYHLAISSGIVDQLVARSVPLSTIRIIYNPVNRRDKLISSSIDDTTRHFLYVGRVKFTGQKRLKDLFDALSQVNGKWCLHIIGDGSDMIKCQTYTRHLEIDQNIIWYGWKKDPWEFVAQEIPSVTALILTSAFEGLGMVLLEALSWGIPCISSDCISGPKDIIINGENGYLYEQGNQQQLVDILNRFIDGDVKIEREKLPETINKFYSDNYYKNFNKAIKFWS